MKSITLTLPMPPTANHIWKKNGKSFFLSKEYQDFKKRVEHEWNLHNKPVLEGRISMGLVLNFSNKRRNDISNRIKALEDSMKGLYFKDDEQIDAIFVKRGDIRKESSCTVIIKEI